MFPLLRRIEVGSSSLISFFYRVSYFDTRMKKCTWGRGGLALDSFVFRCLADKMVFNSKFSYRKRAEPRRRIPRCGHEDSWIHYQIRGNGQQTPRRANLYIRTYQPR